MELQRSTDYACVTGHQARPARQRGDPGPPRESGRTRFLAFLITTMNEHEPSISGERGAPLSAEAGAELERLPLLWDAIYGQTPGYLAILAAVRDEHGLAQLQERFFPFPAAAQQGAAWIRTEAHLDRELYQCAHLLTNPRRRKAAAAPLVSLYADLDGAEVRGSGLVPTVLIESSPGRLQGYWQLTRPVPPAVGEELNRRLAVTLGADRSGWDLTQLLRIPGTRNHKYPAAPLVRVLALTEVRYEPQALARLLAPLPPRQHGPLCSPAEAPAPTSRAEPPVRLSRPARAMWAGADVKPTPDGRIDRSASLVRIARVLYEAGLQGMALAAALAERDQTLGWRKYSDRDDAPQQYQAIVHFIEQGQRTRRRR